MHRMINVVADREVSVEDITERTYIVYNLTFKTNINIDYNQKMALGSGKAVKTSLN